MGKETVPYDALRTRTSTRSSFAGSASARAGTIQIDLHFFLVERSHTGNGLGSVFRPRPLHPQVVQLEHATIHTRCPVSAVVLHWPL